MNVNFHLKTSKAKIETNIFLIAYFQGRRIKFYTGIKVHPNNWNKKKQEVKSSDLLAIQKNNLLLKLSLTLKSTYLEMLTNESTPTLSKLKAALEAITRKKKTHFNLITWTDKVLESRKKSGKFSETSTKGWKSRCKIIKDFAITRPHELDDITLKWCLDFKQHLLNKNVSNNYGSKIIATFKVIMGEALAMEITNNRKWQNKRFTITKEQVHAVYFNVDQLLHLYHAEMPTESLDRVRDSFLVDCFTGLRYADGVDLHQDKIITRDDSRMFAVNTKKTNERVYIPLHPIVERILEKYGGTLPPPISNQKMNKYLKDMAKEAGFDEPIYIARTKGGKREEVKYLTWQKVSTHTGRRSLATNLHLAGVPPKSAMLVTGHKTSKQYMEYIKITSEQNARKLSKSDFFKMKLVKKIS